MFKNLCSCHKTRKKDLDKDDLPYSPTQNFTKLKKNAIADLTLTSTPNQLLKEKNRVNQLMDVKNNNKSLNKLEETISSIEKSNDASNNFNMKNVSNYNQKMNQKNESFKQENIILENNYSFDNIKDELNFKYPQDSDHSDFLEKKYDKASIIINNISNLNSNDKGSFVDTNILNKDINQPSNNIFDINKPFDNHIDKFDSLKNLKNNFDKISLSDNSSANSVFIDKNFKEVIKKTNKFIMKKSDNDQDCISLDIKNNFEEHDLKLNNFGIKDDEIDSFETEDDKSKNFSIVKICKSFLDTSSTIDDFVYEQPLILKKSNLFEPDMIYKMKSNPRGLCIIVNNATTLSDCLRLKNGFNKESLYLKELYKNLGFDVITYENLTAMEIYKMMKSTKDTQEFIQHDAFVFIFLGHGNISFLLGVDRYKIELELVVSYMNNHNCPNLHGKPKIFIVHTCQGNCDNFFEPIPPSKTLRQKEPLKKNEKYCVIPTWTDTVIIFSSFLNDNLHYSSFIKEFGKAICLKAHNSSLQEILLETNTKIMNNEKYKNPFGLNFIYRGFNKDFYFNP